MSTAARIYIVTKEKDGPTCGRQLVKANNQAQALRHVAKSTYTVRAATALEVAEEMQAGQKVVDATAETESTTEDKE